MLLSVVCEFSCEFDGITSTASVTVALEDVSGNAFDAHSLDDRLVKKKKIVSLLNLQFSCAKSVHLHPCLKAV